MYSLSSFGHTNISDPSLFLSNFDETPCSGTGSKTGVLGLEIGSLLFNRSSVKSLVLCYSSTLTVDQLGLPCFLVAQLQQCDPKPGCVEY
jgi:hypothetical protein